MSKHGHNIIAVHCKAGKGRTGTMIASYMVYTGMCETAGDALRVFGQRRTANGKGVTIPSQIRYVHYFEFYCNRRRQGLPPPAKFSLFLHALSMYNTPSSFKSGDIFFTVTQNGRRGLQFRSKGSVNVERDSSKSVATFDLSKKPLLLTDDINVEMSQSTTFGKEKLFQFWFNTRYTSALLADRATKDKEVPPSPGSVPKAAPAAPTGEKDDKSKDKKERKKEAEINMQKLLLSPAVMGEVSSTRLANGEPGFRLILRKFAIDKICKDTMNKSYPEDFFVEMLFAESKAATLDRMLSRGKLVGDESKVSLSSTPSRSESKSSVASALSKSAHPGAAVTSPAARSGGQASSPAAAAPPTTPPADDAATFRIGKLMSVKLPGT